MKTITDNTNNTTEDNTEIIYDNGSSFFDALIKDINNAKHCILFETFIFANDHLGKRVTHALQLAALRKVDVKILVDGYGSPFWATQHASRLERSGAKTSIYHALPWQIWNLSRCAIKTPWLFKWIVLFGRMNLRNHRKTCVIDDSIAYVGSINITKQHLMTSDQGRGWRDAAVRLTHCDLSPLTNAFLAAFNHRSIKEKLIEAMRNIQQDPIFRLNYSRHRRRELYKQLLNKIRSAKKRIWITNAYFIPDHRLLKALCAAASRGVDVRVLLPRKVAIFLPLPWASSVFFETLLQSGVKIFEYTSSILHAKSLILDNWVLIGSSNLNHRSLLHDLEVDVRLRNQRSKNIVKQLFLNDIMHSQQLSISSWKAHRPWYQRLLGKLILYVKYYL